MGEEALGKDCQPTFVVEVPATSANVGVGFDVLGLALDLRARFTFAPADRLLIDGCLQKFRGADNLVWTSYLEACRRLYAKPRQLHITIDSPIPLSGGLGSSSTCVVAGVAAAARLSGQPVSQLQMLDIACDIEGHPDNVAPAIMGGLVSSFVDRGRTHPVRLDVADNVRFVAIAPPYEVLTEDARKVMPTQVALETTIWQVGHCVAAVHALEQGDMELFSSAALDKLHEPYRSRLIPDYEALRRTALAAGAAAFLISGSGSTMLAVCDGDRMAQQVADAVNGMVENHIDGLWVRTLRASSRGAQVLEG